MFLENLVVDALDPQRLGGFWEAALGCERITDEPDCVETTLSVPGGPALDLCFQPVPEPPTPSPRLHVDVYGGSRQAEVVDRLLGLGAERVDLGQGDLPWVVLADPEGNPFCVVEERASYERTGAMAALPLHSADPARDAAFWAWLTGWRVVGGADGGEPDAVVHASGLGPLVEFVPERSPKGAVKNRFHLDVRLEAGEDPDAVAAEIAAHGGRELHLGFGEVPWRHYADPSGNEFCVLPVSGASPTVS